jgi:hypothetical protein
LVVFGTFAPTRALSNTWGAEDEMVRTVTKRAKDAIVDAAHGVRTMAGEALGQATKAAADVVFETTANALEPGRVRLRRATPAMENALGNAARRSVGKNKPGRRKTAGARKRVVKRKTAPRKKASKARRAVKRRLSR